MPLPLIGAGVAGLGAIGSLASDLFGKGSKVNVPTFTPTDPNKVAASTISGNQANLPAAEALTSGINSFSQQQMLDAWSKVFPQYQDMLQSASGKLADMISGKIPAGDVNALLAADAAKASAGGYAGSGMARNLTARDLGLTEYETTQRGIQGLQSLMATLKGTVIAPQASVTNMLIDPTTALANQTQQNEFAWQTELAKAQAQAAPDPTMAALSQTLGGLGSTAMGAGTLSALGAFDGGIFGRKPTGGFSYS